MLTYIEKVFKRYPSLLAGLLSIATLVGVKLGFHNVTTAELLAIVSAATAATALFHALAGLGVKAGVRLGVKAGVREAQRGAIPQRSVR
jgi:predicted tellurium resistance membrane protein TerC